MLELKDDEDRFRTTKAAILIITYIINDVILTILKEVKALSFDFVLR